MSRLATALLAGALAAAALPAHAQAPTPPLFATTKVDGTEGVYIFRYQGHQAPIKYVVYSHSHYDHIAGGKPFKDVGAVFVAHRNTKSLLEARKAPDIVVPDLVVDDGGGKLELGGTTLELLYLGKNHGDNSLVMRLPKEKIIFVVD